MCFSQFDERAAGKSHSVPCRRVAKTSLCLGTICLSLLWGLVGLIFGTGIGTSFGIMIWKHIPQISAAVFGSEVNLELALQIDGAVMGAGIGIIYGVIIA